MEVRREGEERVLRLAGRDGFGRSRLRARQGGPDGHPPRRSVWARVEAID